MKKRKVIIVAEPLNLEFTVANSGQSVQGLVYIQSYSLKPRKKKSVTDPDKQYVTGKLVRKYQSIGFNIFDDTLVDAFKANNFEGNVLNIIGSVNEFRGTVNLIINGLDELGSYNLSDFINTHNVEGNYAEFSKYLESHFTNEELGVINTIFTVPADGFNRFGTEFAGAVMHDACRGGLLHHTLKMLKLYDVVATLDYRFEQAKEAMPNFDKIVRLGIILHDLGKIEEMEDGVYTPASIINHRIRCVTYLAKCEREIKREFGEEAFDILLSIVAQHHGAFEGDKPTTVQAMVVHLIDYMDSQMTHIIEGVLAGGEQTADNRRFVRCDDMKLYF